LVSRAAGDESAMKMNDDVAARGIVADTLEERVELGAGGAGKAAVDEVKVVAFRDAHRSGGSGVRERWRAAAAVGAEAGRGDRPVADHICTSGGRGTRMLSGTSPLPRRVVGCSRRNTAPSAPLWAPLDITCYHIY